MRRRDLLLGAAAFSAPQPDLILLSPAEAARIKPSLEALRRKWISRGPWSVTFQRPGALSKAGPHDFFSEGPYWWPDPRNPKGPYIRRDGEVNPDRFTANDRDLSDMSEAVFALGAAAFYLNDKQAAARAWQVLDTWFLDPKTLMNPNLEFGQAIRGVTEGRGIGIIDTRPLIWCAAGITHLAAAFPDERDKPLRAWFGAYLEWLTTSKKGIDERDNGNNHSTWWATQTAAYARLCGNRAAEEATYNLALKSFIPKQFKPDGSAPAEEARTKSLGYSIMNLDGFALLARIAGRAALWDNLSRPIEYLAPFVLDPSKWTKPQISPIGRNRGYFLGLAGLHFQRRGWIEAQRRLGVPSNTWGALLASLLGSAA
ncbi:MAG: alginate lyase family protein [Bryobacteraceae bacterium]|nr:alginate lyase family protein [Bryobacteraceae bacterium]